MNLCHSLVIEDFRSCRQLMINLTVFPFSFLISFHLLVNSLRYGSFADCLSIPRVFHPVQLPVSELTCKLFDNSCQIIHFGQPFPHLVETLLLAPAQSREIFHHDNDTPILHASVRVISLILLCDSDRPLRQCRIAFRPHRLLSALSIQHRVSFGRIYFKNIFFVFSYCYDRKISREVTVVSEISGAY